MSDALAETHDLRVVHRHRRTPERVALDGVSLEVRAGQRLALLGPNGSGKSTLLRALATLQVFDAGSVRLFGTSLEPGVDATVVRSRLGVVFQNTALDRLLTLRENLRTQAALFGIGNAAATERIEAWAARLGITDRLDERVGRLSGGLARRGDLARALLTEPDLLLLDEPTTGLDHAARGEFLDLLDTAQTPGRAVVITTHLMDEAELADRVVMLAEGRVVADGTPAELRRGLGRSLLRIGPQTDEPWIAELAAAQGVERRRTLHGDTLILAQDAEALATVAAELTRREAAFEVGPPTLADAYLALTGREMRETEVGSATI